MIIKAAEERDGCHDVESAPNQQRSGYQPIPQFDHTYQTSGVRDGGVDNPTYAEVVASSSSQPKPGASEAPPSYSAIVKGGTVPN